MENSGKSVRQKTWSVWECEASPWARVGDEAAKPSEGQFSGILGVSREGSGKPKGSFKAVGEAQELERLPCALMHQVLFLGLFEPRIASGVPAPTTGGLRLTALVFASLSRLRFLVWRRPRDPEEGRDDRRSGKETSEEDRIKLQSQ